jgi:hypothetical protein
MQIRYDVIAHIQYTEQLKRSNMGKKIFAIIEGDRPKNMQIRYYVIVKTMAR